MKRKIDKRTVKKEYLQRVDKMLERVGYCKNCSKNVK